MCASAAPLHAHAWQGSPRTTSIMLFFVETVIMEGMRWQLFAMTLIGCAGSATPRTARTTGAMSPTAQASSEVRFASRELTTQVTCPDAALRADGSMICPNEAAAQGLT